MNRRSFLTWTGALAGAAMLRRASAQEAHGAHGAPDARPRGGAPAPGALRGGGAPPPATAAARPAPSALLGGHVPVVTPNGATLPWRIVRGVKIGHLVAEELDHEFAPGLRGFVYGYNGRTPGPTIEAVEGDRVRIYVTNRLPDATTVHWHGFVLPNGMDGVTGLNQKPIARGETFVYEFTLRHAGTFMYHSHFDEATQLAFGLVGMFVVHPRRPRGPRVERDFALLAHEWRIDAGTRRPDPVEMSDFNVATFNAKAFPGTEPLLVGRGERVRIRLGNLSIMSHHPIHLHGVHFQVTGTDGGEVPESARFPTSTVIVPVGGVRTIELAFEESGDWAMHCHMPHHMMNQMGHARPQFVGADARRLDRRMARIVPGYMTMGTTGMGGMGEMDMPLPANSIPMRGTDGPFAHMDVGGMFTIIKVREQPTEADRVGWYAHAPGTVASPADPERMKEDGIEPPRRA
jgi:manganese oxidase